VAALLLLGCVRLCGASTWDEDELRAENARLRAEVTRLRVQAGEPPLLPVEKHWTEHLQNVTLNPNELKIEEVEMVGVFAVMIGLWVLPVMTPFRKCCQTRLHSVYPIILLLNICIFCFAMNYLYLLSANFVFFTLVEIASFLIDKVEQVLIGIAGVCILFVLWKFKDRVLETLGIENAAHYLGEPRDWATCWSMKRMQGIEVLIWKVEDLPSAKVHTANDLFCEVRHGYNPAMRTRVHGKAGHCCTFKETMQLNYDPYDHEGRFFIVVRNQDVFGASDLGQVQFGVDQIARFAEPAPNVGRTIGWGTSNNSGEGSIWAPSRFRCIDLIPAGRIYLRFIPVDETDGDRSWFGCCWPSAGTRSRETAIEGDAEA
jgi:hypothetical protein